MTVFNIEVQASASLLSNLDVRKEREGERCSVAHIAIPGGRTPQSHDDDGV